MATKEQKDELVEILKFTPRTYTMYIGGYGGESYAGRVSKESYEYFKEHKIDLEEFASDWDDKFSDVPSELQPFSPGSPYDCDGLFHNSGAELSNLNEIRIDDEHGNEHWVCAAGINELEDEGVTVEESGGFDFDDLEEDDIVFWGGQGEKGSFFEGEIYLKQPFDPKKLKVSYENCDGWWIISYVEYDGEEIDGSNGYSTTGKWSEYKWVLGDNVETYEPVSREDDEDEDDEESSWPEVHETNTDNPIDFPSESLKTDWFPVDVKPVHKGTYEAVIDAAWPLSGMRMVEWTGRSWKEDGNKVAILKWRGLTENVNG